MTKNCAHHHFCGQELKNMIKIRDYFDKIKHYCTNFVIFIPKNDVELNFRCGTAIFFIFSNFFAFMDLALNLPLEDQVEK